MTGLDESSADDTVLRFPDGIPGFPHERHFRLDAMVDDGAFQLLNGIDSGDVSMVVMQPWLFFPEYAPQISAADQRELGLADAQDAVLFCSVSIDRDTEQMYVNLRGPFVVNSRTNTGRQVVLDDDLPLRAPVELQVS